MKSSLAATDHRLCRRRWIYNQDHDQCQDVKTLVLFQQICRHRDHSIHHYDQV